MWYLERLKRPQAPLCVFGAMDNERGKEIAAEMLEWLQPVYDLHIIHHDGTEFEYPALNYMQQLSIKTGRPILYLHTRGAVNTWNTTVPTRRMWRHEFGEVWQKYFLMANTYKPRVICPFVDYDRETRYNGFVANTAAMQAIRMKRIADRMWYERMWRNVNTEIIGTLINGNADIKQVRSYLYLHYGD